MLAVHMVEGQPVPSDEDIQRAYKAVDDFNRGLQESGAWVFAGGLLPPDTATVVRAAGGKVVMTDGPFAETKEQLGGYYLLECKDLDEALMIAAKIPSVEAGGTVEVRPLVPMSEAARTPPAK